MKRTSQSPSTTHSLAVRLILPSLAGLILMHLTGCASYRLGSSLPPDVKSVHVPTFVNKTNEPLLQSDTTRAAIQEFQRDGTLRVLDKDEADLLLEVSLVDFTLEPLRFGRDETKTAEEYRMRIKADILLTHRTSGKVMAQRQVAGEAFFDFTGDLGSSKRTALPVAAADLAHDIVESVVEYW